MAIAIARRQRGVVARRQLLEAGVSAAAIDRLLANGRLVRLHRGVYAIGHAALPRDALWIAAVLAGGPGAVLSHRSAAAAWGLREGAPRLVDVTVRGRAGLRQRTLRAHTGRLHPGDVTRLDGIPITTVPRTLLDLAEVETLHVLRRAVDRSMELRLFDLRAIHATLGRANGRRGVKPLRRVLDELVGRPSGSRQELEAAALDLIRAHRLPYPVVNTLLEGHEVDLLWRERRLVVELDSWTHHGTRPAFERDRRRDVDLQLAGYRVVRFTWRQVTEEPRWVATRIRALLQG
ncbi:MAG TPA: type IV toxin-antitoxin system AbiEi family antitoxin domain-containing protein [Capillimicrobium sp.]|nr:type IV toxin-antitoxin system AbiEi family antitoxin domain-containing protein [Capillimicrobium sp.]